jgi:hypothetical protein
MMTCLLRHIVSRFPLLDADKVVIATRFVPPQGNLIQGSPFLVPIGLSESTDQSASLTRVHI